MAGRRADRTVRKKGTAGLTQQRPAAAWTENKVRVLSTELILERLAGFGIVTSVDEVVQQARAEHVASAIAEGWRERFPVSPHSVDDDFVDLAARVLWERLLPEPQFRAAGCAHASRLRRILGQRRGARV